MRSNIIEMDSCKKDHVPIPGKTIIYSLRLDLNEIYVEVNVQLDIKLLILTVEYLTIKQVQNKVDYFL